jgi:hypothetical protein
MSLRALAPLDELTMVVEHPMMQVKTKYAHTWFSSVAQNPKRNFDLTTSLLFSCISTSYPSILFIGEAIQRVRLGDTQ